MNVILYSSDFEPITVIDLPKSVLDKIEQQGGVRLCLGKSMDEFGNKLNPPMCTVCYTKLRWLDGHEKILLYTEDDDVALQLKPDWLPGQRGTHNLYHNHIKQLTKRLINLTRDDD